MIEFFKFGILREGTWFIIVEILFLFNIIMLIFGLGDIFIWIGTVAGICYNAIEFYEWRTGD